MAILLPSTQTPDISNVVVLFVFLGVLSLAVKYLNRTDIPKIKGLPELPGVPMFGSLFLLGKHHARNCRELAKKYGPVFQVRLGNRVCIADKRAKLN